MAFIRHHLAVSIALIVANGPISQAQSAETLIDRPISQTPDVRNSETITVSATGSVIVSDTALDLYSGYSMNQQSLNNSGQIISTQGRAINLSPPVNNTWMGSYKIRNNADGLIQGVEDGIRLRSDGSVSSDIYISNSGTIGSLNGSGIDLSAAGGKNNYASVINEKTGLIRSVFNDGVKLGSNGSIENYGEISTGDARHSGDEFDGIDMSSASRATVYNRGTVSGGRYGVIVGQDALIENRTLITGRNGAGVFSEANADVRNNFGGVISGGANGLQANADGDGIRIKNSAGIWNEGTIQGTSARGVNSYGIANTSEGISAGGGFIIFNSAYPRSIGKPPSLISGANNGILIDDGNGGSAFSAIRVHNFGIIQGLDGFGMKFVGNFADEVKNGGLISGSNGLALDMGGGDDTLQLFTGSRFEGLVDGGSGHNTLIMGDTENNQYDSGSFGESRNFQVLEVRRGDWTLTGEGDFSEGAHVFDYARLTNQGGIAGNVQVDKNAQYRGGGTVDNLTINGTLYTSAGLGGPQVNGDLVMGKGSTWIVDVNADGSDGTARITGNANLTGSSLQIYNSNPENLYPWHSTYRILEADSITGTFLYAGESNYAFYKTTLAYGPHTVDLNLTSNEVSFAAYASTANGARAAQAIESTYGGRRSRDPIFGPGYMPRATDDRLYNALLNTTESSAGLAIEKLAGSGNANLGIATLSASSLVGASMLAAMQQAGGGSSLLVGLAPEQTPILAATDVPESARNLNDPNARGRVWLQALGGYGRLDGKHGNPGLEQRTSGSVLGVDWSLSSLWRLGVVGGYSKTNLNNHDIDGKLHSWHVGAYAMRQDGPLAIRLGASYSHHDGDNKRSVEFDNFSDRPKGSYDANSQQAFAELSYTLGRGHLNIEPFASLGYQRYHRNRYTEKGGAAALAVHEQNQDNFNSTFGVRLAQLNQLKNGISLTPRASFGWRHTYGELESDTLQAFVIGGSAFKVEGSALDRDSLRLEAGLDIGLSARNSLSFGYNGELGSNSRNHGWTGQWQMRF